MHLDSKGRASPLGGVWARMMPLSKDFSSRVWRVTPVHLAPDMIVWWRGAGPRKLMRVRISVASGERCLLWQDGGMDIETTVFYTF